MKVKTSCEIATIAAIRYFSTRPDDALAFIKEIYDLAYIDALLDKKKKRIATADTCMRKETAQSRRIPGEQKAR